MKIDKTLKHLQLYKYSKHCAYCGAPLSARTMEVDHIIPVSKGGKTEDSNLLPSCKACNATKRDHSIEEFRMILKSSPYTAAKESKAYRQALVFGLIARKEKDVKFYYEEHSQYECLKDENTIIPNMNEEWVDIVNNRLFDLTLELRQDQEGFSK